MPYAYLSLGSNIGGKKENLKRAIQLFREKADNGLIVSSFYMTEPIGFTEQDVFINCCLRVETTLQPHKLLELCQWIEGTLKRERLVRWGPRTIDCDIILYEDFQIESEALIVPHPRYKERAFVLFPLIEICREPQQLRALREAANHVMHQGIRKIDYE